MRLHILLSSMIAFLPASALAMGMPELPPELPTLELPEAVPDLERLPQLPDLADLFPELGQAQGEPPELGVPLGPPSPLPPEGVPPGLQLGPPSGVPGSHLVAVPEPGTGLLFVTSGLALMGLRGRRRRTSQF